jgi:hypothetical protein
LIIDSISWASIGIPACLRQMFRIRVGSRDRDGQT